MVSAADTLCQRVELFISGRKLRDMDTFSKSDPRCVIKLLTGRPPNVKKVIAGKTEVIKNNLNPNWETPVTVDYHFE